MGGQLTDSVLISDLGSRVQSGPTSSVALPRHWRTVPYDADGFSGVMLGCGEATCPQPVQLRLDVVGPHRILLGIYAYATAEIRVRLSRDLCCTRLSAPRRSVIEKPVIHEVLWKESEVTGQDLFLESAYDRKPVPGALAYVRLEPIDAVPDSVPRSDPWRGMCISNDGCGVFRSNPHYRPEDILEDLEMIPDSSCMRSLLWGNGNADSCNYPTVIGNPMFLETWQDPHIACDGAIGWPNVSRWRESGWDSLRVVRDYTRTRAWELHVYIRMEAFAGSYPHEELVWSEFFYAHPEWWCLDRQGNRVNRLSYAYPQVQDHMLDLISEVLSYDPDGVCLCLTRGIPVVLYEPPMVEGFRREHGLDPRTLAETDPRWLEFQAAVFTPFVRKARERMRPEQRLSVMVPGNEADCRKWGLDVAGWVREGIIDDLYPVGQQFNATNTHFDAPEALDYDYFQGLEGREKIRVIPCFYTWTLYRNDPVAFRRLVRHFLDQGADQYCIWDGDASYDDGKVGDIGYGSWEGPEYTPPAPPAARTVAVRSLNGFHIDRYGSCEIV